jgi:hypothetical protein
MGFPAAHEQTTAAPIGVGKPTLQVDKTSNPTMT